MGYKSLHIILIVGVLFAFSCKKSPTTFETASKGILSVDSIQEKELYSLDGEWEFYWEQLLSPADFQNYSKDTVNFVLVNSVWNKYIVDGQEIGKFGYGTFHLKLVIPKGNYSLKIRRIETAYKLWINEKLIATNGTVGKEKDESIPKLYPQILYFSTDKDTIDITIQVSNFHHRVGGIQNKIFIGKPQTIYDIQTSYLYVVFFIIGSFFLIAVYFLFYYFISKNAGLAPLYFSLTLISSIIFASVSSNNHYTNFFFNLPWEYIKKLDFIGNYGRLMFFVLFIKSIFNKEKSLNNRFIKIVVYIFVSFFIVIIFFKPIIFTNTLYPFLLLTFFSLLYIAVQLVRLSLKKDLRARIILFGIVMIIVTMINDSLSYSNILNTPDLVHYGLFIFTVSNAVVLSMSIASATNTSKKYTELWGKVNQIRTDFSNIKPYELGEMLKILSKYSDSSEAVLFIRNKDDYKCEIIFSNDSLAVSKLTSSLKYDSKEIPFEKIKENKETILENNNVVFPILAKDDIKALLFFKNVNITDKSELEIIEILHSEISTFIDNYKYFYGLENINANLETIIANRTNTIIAQKEKLIEKSVSLDAKLEELNITNSIIDDLNNELLESSAEISRNISILEEKKLRIKKQKNIIENKIKTINSSIAYSKVIQKSLLSSNQKINRSEYFEFSIPKALVGGDIWFAKSIKDYKIIAIIDSTGSNVISTFLTMLINSLFEDAIAKHFEIATKSPDIFLKEVKNSFFKIIDKNDIVDVNFDVFYCSINMNNGEMLYCGENLLGHIIRGDEVFELGSEKRVIIERKNLHFPLNKFDLKYGDILLLQTDGFINQIRKLDMRKFGRQRMNDLMYELTKIPFEKQKNEIIAKYENWKLNFKQVDDYLLIGFLFSENEA